METETGEGTVVSGLLLAGGSSSRFGDGDKALVEVDDEPMVKHVAEAVAEASDSFTVSCRRSQKPELTDALKDVAGGVPEFLVDAVEYAGPVAALDNCVEGLDGDLVLVVGCDVPLIEPEVLTELCSQLKGSARVDAVLPSVEGRAQPLAGVYAVDALLRGLDAVDEVEEVPVFRLLDYLEFEAVEARQLPGGERALFNVNTREDLEAVRRRHFST